MLKNKKKRGHPVGSTMGKKRRESEKEKSAKHHIICNYMWEVKHADTSMISKKDIFAYVYEDTKKRYGLNDKFSFPYETALSRIRRNNISADGLNSPLLPIEQEIVDLLLCMSKIKRALTASDGLRLINELIDGTEVQKRLIEWKTKMKTPYKHHSDLGRVDLSYWNKFLKRNKYQLRSKVAKKYAIDRSNWTSYLNFRDMYLHIKDILVNDSKIATKLPEPIWVDCKGESS